MTSQLAVVEAETDPLRRARQLQRSWEYLLGEGALGTELPPVATAGLRPTIVESWRRSLARDLDPTDLLAPIEADSEGPRPGAAYSPHAAAVAQRRLGRAATAAQVFAALNEIRPARAILVDESPSNHAALHTAWPITELDFPAPNGAPAVLPTASPCEGIVDTRRRPGQPRPPFAASPAPASNERRRRRRRAVLNAPSEAGGEQVAGDRRHRSSPVASTAFR